MARILVADDEPPILGAPGTTLRAAGHEPDPRLVDTLRRRLPGG